MEGVPICACFPRCGWVGYQIGCWAGGWVALKTEDKSSVSASIVFEVEVESELVKN